MSLNPVLWIPDGNFSHFFCKICIVCLKRQKINEKEAEDGGFFKKKKTKITNLMMQSENAFA